MTTIAAMHAEMAAAVAALDFEAAARLRDRISLLANGVDGDPDGLQRQQPGAMGLGTSRQRVEPPAGWVKPVKPDPMTKGRKR